MIREKITHILGHAVRKKFGDEVVPRIVVQSNDNENHGDYATPVALGIAKILKKNPLEIASDIAEKLRKEGDMFRDVRVASPGFINFFVADKLLFSEFSDIMRKKEKYGSGKKKKESYSLDYLDANPTGPIHIGHARSGFLGDCLARVLKKSGYMVSREFYVNNAKSSGQITSLGKTALGRGEEYKHKELLSLLKKLVVSSKLKKILRQPHDMQERDAGFFVASLIQKENKKFLKKIGIEFNLFFEEQWAYDRKLLDGVLAVLQERRAVYKKDGAVWFRASKFGDTEDRVLVRSTGDPTYVLPDLAYHVDRLKKRKFDVAIDIFGADHHGYGPRLRGALAAMGIEPHRVVIITTQTVRLMKKGREVKMSKRKGLFVTLERLIKEVGLDAARFFFLMQSPETHMDFDLTLAKERSVKNPIYYVQYAYVRAKNILEKSKIHNQKSRNKSSIVVEAFKTSEERMLIKKLIQFPEVIEDTTKDYQVIRLTRYVVELARIFHNFYEKRHVIGEEKNIMESRLALVYAVKIVFGNSLRLLGISLPKKM